MAATEVLDSMIAKSRVESGVVLLTGSSTNIFNKEVPTLMLRTPQETLGTQAHVQLQPSLDFYSVVLGSELLGPTLQAEKKSEPSDSNESVDMLSEQNTSSARPVTHIEIIRQKPNAVKTKHATSRRVTGANRVVPLLTSMWQKRELKGIEPSLAETYRTILDNPDNTHEHECESCHKQFLSVTQVEQHFKEMHPQQQVVLEQCFVCRKKYVIQSQLKHHLSTVHGIQYPEMICKICFMEFNTVMEQKAHGRKHDKIYSCQYCSTKFASLYFCQKHYDKHLADMKPYQCMSCGKRFQNSISLNIHHNRHKHLKCLFCDTLFVDELELLMHVRDHGIQSKHQFLAAVEYLDQEETQLEDMLCAYLKICTESRVTAGTSKDISDCVEGLLCSVSQALDAEHSVPEPSADKRGMKCKLCGLEVQSPRELVEHRRNKHMRSCTCLVCGKRSRSVSQTWRHIATHVDKVKSNDMVYVISKTQQQCHVCHKMFPSKGKKNFHLENVHKIETIQRPHGCTICLRKFQHKISRDRHMLLHGKEKSGLKCSVCSQVFLRPKFLVRHIAEHKSHNECHVCNKTFSKRRQLRLHLNGHSRVVFGKKYKCSLCSVTCQGASGLREHQRIHTGERPFSCNQCERRFKRLQALKKHINTVHSGPGAVSHACASCPMTFNNRGNLLRHFLRIHRGLRRFICGLCGARYGQNQDLRRHLKAKHQVDMPVISCVDKKAVSEVYVLPPIDKIPESHPHVEKIKDRKSVV